MKVKAYNVSTKFDTMFLIQQPQKKVEISPFKIKEHATVLRDLDVGRHSLKHYQTILSQYKDNPTKFDYEFDKLRTAILNSWK